MREITDHIVEGDLPQNQLTIQITDEPGADGANYRYEISGYDPATNPSLRPLPLAGEPNPKVILFQNGPIKEAGVNGITQEALLAIVIDRLRSFQAGPYPSEENEHALHHCTEALDFLKMRTEERLTRGVEGQTKT